MGRSTAKAVGFDFRKGHRGPLLPRLSCDYGWAGDAIDANETTRWIRTRLARLKGEEEDLTFSSHGLKATPLSWTSKVQAQPLGDFVECLSAIRPGIFHPDRTKSGMIAQGASSMGSRFSLDASGVERASSPNASFECAPANCAPDEGDEDRLDSQGADGHVIDQEASDSESESSVESDGETQYESFGKGESQEVIPPVSVGPDLEIFQNPKTKSLHSRAKGSSGKLTCGRSLDDMKPLNGKVFSNRWTCKQCTANRPLRDVGAMVNSLSKKQGASA